MSGSPAADPPRWTREQLDRARERARSEFVRERKREGTDTFEGTVASAEANVRRLLSLTSDLLAPDAAALSADPGLLEMARYLVSPPISQDDLKTLVGGPVDAQGQAVGALIMELLDPVRFPWVREGREPTPSEREFAIRCTAIIRAIERIRTQRRMNSSKRQEHAVVVALEEAGYRQRARVGELEVPDQLQRGTFAQHTKMAGARCDIVVRLRDGRLLAIECKVSNSEVNSVKRLREVAEKAQRWTGQFGRTVVVAAVLAGVYKLEDLIGAQGQGIALFFEHDLTALQRFVSPDP